MKWLKLIPLVKNDWMFTAFKFFLFLYFCMFFCPLAFACEPELQKTYEGNGLYRFEVVWSDCEECEGNVQPPDIASPRDIDGDGIEDCFDFCAGCDCEENARCATFTYFWDFGDGFFWYPTLETPEPSHGSYVYHRYSGTSSDLNPTTSGFDVSVRILPTYSDNPPPPLLTIEADPNADDSTFPSPFAWQNTNFSENEEEAGKAKLIAYPSSLALGDVSDLVVAYKHTPVGNFQLVVELPDEGISIIGGSSLSNNFWQVIENSETSYTLIPNLSAIVGDEFGMKLPIQIAEEIDFPDTNPDNTLSIRLTCSDSIRTETSKIQLRINQLRDPNNITVRPTELDYCKRDEKFLTYEVFFQNTGAVSADRVEADVKFDPPSVLQGLTVGDVVILNRFPSMTQDHVVNAVVTEVLESEGRIKFLMLADDGQTPFLPGYYLPGVNIPNPPATPSNETLNKSWNGKITFRIPIKEEFYLLGKISATAKTTLSRGIESSSDESDFPAETEIVLPNLATGLTAGPWQMFLKAGAQSLISDPYEFSFGGIFWGVKFRKGLFPSKRDECRKLARLYYQPEIMLSSNIFQIKDSSQIINTHYLDVVPFQLCVPLGEVNRRLGISAGYMISLPFQVNPEVDGLELPLISNIDNSFFVNVDLALTPKLELGIRGLARYSQILNLDQPSIYSQIHLGLRL